MGLYTIRFWYLSKIIFRYSISINLMWIRKLLLSENFPKAIVFILSSNFIDEIVFYVKGWREPEDWDSYRHERKVGVEMIRLFRRFPTQTKQNFIYHIVWTFYGNCPGPSIYSSFIRHPFSSQDSWVVFPTVHSPSIIYPQFIP